MTIEAYIITHDTAQAIGLREILLNHFNIHAEISSAMELNNANEYPNAIFLPTPQCYIENQDFFISKRNKTIIILQQDSADFLTINVCCSESKITSQFSSILYSLENSNDFNDSILSQREIEVLRLIAMGHINKEIADKLSISINTVLTHRKNISTKLGIKSVSGLGIYAVMNGYISEKDLMR